MTDTYDTIVLGLGGMGSAAAAHLAARRVRVLGLEQFTPGHDRGSSHGDSRIIRQAYFEDPSYVPLLLRSYELYRDLDRDDPGLFVQTGGVMVGSPGSRTVSGTLASAEQHGLEHEVLDGAELHRRFPAFVPREGDVAVYEACAGYVRPERTVLAHLRRAEAAGAQLRFGERVTGWSADDGHVRVRTTAGEYEAERLVITSGAWAPDFAKLPDVPLVVERQLLHWFVPRRPELFAGLPIYIWEFEHDTQIYGFPAIDGPDGPAKIAFFRRGSVADPDDLDRDVRPEEVEDMRAAAATVLPELSGEHVRSLACMYTTTPDEHFVIGRHPVHDAVVVAAGFSGHGFKFTPVVGEILADLATDGRTTHDIALFDPTRFAAASTR